MKKYSLTIVYDEDKEEISSIKQKIVDLDPKTAQKEISVSMNTQFVENLPQLEQKVVNALFSAADMAGGLMGDA
jgi:predicted DNA-binding transcriptional regulator YafY